MTAEGVLLSKDERNAPSPGGRLSWLAQWLPVTTRQVWLVWGVVLGEVPYPRRE